MRLISRAALAGALACLALPTALLADAGSPASANDLRVSASAPNDWSDPPDFEALRAEYAARADFDARCAAERPLTEAFLDLQAERWSELLAITEPWTARCPVDMEAHTLRATALERLGRPEEADAHEMWARGLFEAVLASGDGQTPATAYRVVAEFEEYAMLRAFRYPPERVTDSANGVDALLVRADGEERLLYFRTLWDSSRNAAGVDDRHASN